MKKTEEILKAMPDMTIKERVQARKELAELSRRQTAQSIGSPFYLSNRRKRK